MGRLESDKFDIEIFKIDYEEKDEKKGGNYMSFESIAIILGAIGTFILAIIAVFHDVIKEFINKPKLDSEIEFSPPHCHRVYITGGYYDYYFALKIWNKGKTKAAKNKPCANFV